MAMIEMCSKKWFLSVVQFGDCTEVLAWKDGERVSIRRSASGVVESTGRVIKVFLQDSKKGVIQVSYSGGWNNVSDSTVAKF